MSLTLIRFTSTLGKLIGSPETAHTCSTLAVFLYKGIATAFKTIGADRGFLPQYTTLTFTLLLQHLYVRYSLYDHNQTTFVKGRSVLRRIN